MRQHKYYIYILSSPSGTLYTGVTNNIERRIFEHQHKLVPGFTQKYNCTSLVHFEEYSWIQEAIAREKEIKAWRREKKEKLIRITNPKWYDLSKKFRFNEVLP